MHAHTGWWELPGEYGSFTSLGDLLIFNGVKEVSFKSVTNISAQRNKVNVMLRSCCQSFPLQPMLQFFFLRKCLLAAPDTLGKYLISGTPLTWLTPYLWNETLLVALVDELYLEISGRNSTLLIRQTLFSIFDPTDYEVLEVMPMVGIYGAVSLVLLICGRKVPEEMCVGGFVIHPQDLSCSSV